MSTSWLMRSLSTAASRGSATEKELFACPMNRWSYSIPADQFGAKPYSTPAPTVAPQRVLLAETRPMPVVLSNMLNRLLVTAAPPFTYNSVAFHAQPSWPVKRPRASVFEVVESVGL